MDDFGVKYVGKTHVEHLLSVLKADYKISANWSGKRYLGINLDWDYAHLKVHLSMLQYVIDALKRFNHKHPHKPQDQPYPHVKPNYGAKAQYAADADSTPPLSPADKKFEQEVVSTFLYYARALDVTMLPALSSLSTQ